MQSEQDQAEAPGQPKRRKLRKGTHSCWACKRRKERCVSSDTGVCESCRRRGSKCVSQEFDHDLHVASGKKETASAAARSPIIIAAKNCSTPDSVVSRRQDFVLPTEDEFSDAGLLSRSRLSEILHAATPSEIDCQIIFATSHRYPAVAHASALTMPAAEAHRNSQIRPSQDLVRPVASAHPVLHARYMLRLVALLQDLHLKAQCDLAALSEPPRQMIRRLAETAIKLVTSQDKLLASIEGLECVVMESIYHGNCGSLQLSWMACRRSMLLAQLLGLHLPESRQRYQILNGSTEVDPQYLWFRIVHYDRYMCLLLGLPQGSRDLSMASGRYFDADTDLGRLERTQCAIAARILQRNESDPDSMDFAKTMGIDRDLQHAARCLPSKWWLVPDLKHSSPHPETVLVDMRGLYSQVFYFNLLNQLHVPYMLLATRDRRYEYSKLACINASREILSRFVALRSSHLVAYNCRTVDYMAVMASLTIILAHLSSYSASSGATPAQPDIFSHLYLGDRAMMERVQENMEEVSRLNDDPLSAQSAELLSRLLQIEAEAAQGHVSRAQSLTVRNSSASNDASKGNEAGNATRVHVPYFGLITFAMADIAVQTGRMPSENNDRSPPLARSAGGLAMHTMQMAEHTDFTANSTNNFAEVPRSTRASTVNGISPSCHGIPTEPDDIDGLLNSDDMSHANGWDTKLTDREFFNPLLPGLAGTNDWSLDGVDMAYFDKLINGILEGRT
jgi:hypothetical protein